MIFNDVSSSSGLVQDANFWVNTNQTNYPLKDKARNATEWLKKAGVWIWQSAGDWEFDDSNLSTLPVGNRDLVYNQQSYTLPTTVFKIDRLEVMDQEGNYRLLKPFDKSQVTDEAMTQFYKTPGMPLFYDLVGQNLNLYPAPAEGCVTLEDGLQIYIGRDVDPFSASDTTKEPGFSEYFHRIISVGMALDYATSKGMKDKVSTLKKMLYGDPSISGDLGLKGELQQAYGSNHRDFKTKLRPRVDTRI